LECHRENQDSPRSSARRKFCWMQNPQNRLRLIRHWNIPNESPIQSICPFQWETLDTTDRHYGRYVDGPIRSGNTRATPMLIWEIILPHREELWLPDLVCTFLQGDVDCPRLEFWSQQMAFALNVPESRHNIPVSTNEPAKIFQCPHSCPQSVPAHGLDEPEHWGKHAFIDRDREQQILN
jgi:hypothetical protein